MAAATYVLTSGPKSGETRTTCGGHRSAGLAFADGVAICRLCKAPAAIHESTGETVRRNSADPMPTPEEVRESEDVSVAH